MKIKSKIFLQLILLIVLVSGAIIGTTLHLSDESREEVLGDVSQTLRHLQELSSRELEDARVVAYQGITDASGLATIDQVKDISLTTQNQFFKVVKGGIDSAGERIGSTLTEQNAAVKEGLDELLIQVNRAVSSLVSMDREAFGAIAEVSRENVEYLQWASEQGLNRLHESRKQMSIGLTKLSRKNLDEVDVLLTGILRENDFPSEQEAQLARRFLEVKEDIARRQAEFFDTVFSSLDEQRRVLGKEIDIASSNVQWSIEREKKYTTVGQKRKISEVTSRLNQEKGRLHYHIDMLALAMRKTLAELKVKLPEQLKKESETTNLAIGDQVHLAKAGTTAAQRQVASRITTNTVNANREFESAIQQSRGSISESFDQAQQKTTRLSLYIALGCGALAMGLGFIMIRNITDPISRVLHFAHKMSRGDLSQRLEEGSDEMGAMGCALNRMADDLEQLQKDTINSFTDTLDKVLDCIFMFDPETFQFSYVNQGAVDHLGYTREQLLQMTPLDIKPEFTPESFRAMAEMLTSGRKESQTFTTVHRDINGKDIPVEVLLRHVTPPGNEPRFVAVVRDITERIEERREKEQMQAELMHSQKLESVGQLAAGIAHEINTPTQFIGTNIEFLSDTVEDLREFFVTLQEQMKGCPDKVKQKLAEAIEELDWEYLEEELPVAVSQSRDGVERVSSLVAAMKRFSHPGSREKAPCDLHEVITTALTVSRNEWKYVADVITDFSDNLPLVPLYSDEIGQVVLNMMVNAAHAIQEKQQKDDSIEKGIITISTQLLENEVELIFEDSGTGIPEDIIKKVFDPFFTTKEVGKGTGQGLAICHDVITRKHGGRLEVTSGDGCGARFVLGLPLASLQPDVDGQKNELDQES